VNNVVQLDPATRRRRLPGQGGSAADVLSVAEAARYLGLSVNTTYAHLANGTIPGRRVGRRWLVSRAGLDAWLGGASHGGR
jgi:excisionase family DNA binding protein